MNWSADSPTIYLVDGDPEFRHYLNSELVATDWRVEDFESAEALLAHEGLRSVGCVLLDNSLPGMTGLELQKELAQRQLALPVVFASLSADVPTAVAAMKAGAFDFMLKSIPLSYLRERIQSALALNDAHLRADEKQRQFAQRLAKVTEREHEVMALALTGSVNKQIAYRLGMSLRTVEGHRSRILLKTGVESLLEFLYLARKAGFDVDRHFPSPPAEL